MNTRLSRNRRQRRSCQKEEGYILLALLLIVALMVIAAAVALPKISFQIKRDREEEMIHRGCQYARAIKAYYKKFGRYPAKIEDLENTNNMRFLRKRYKDPMNCPKGKCQDFKLLHFGEVQLTLSGGMGTAPNLNNSSTGSSAFGSQPGGTSGFGPQTSNSSNGLGGTSNTATGGNAGATPDQGEGTNTDASSADNGQQPGSGDRLSGQVFGGGPIVGVASASKKEGIHEFNHKRKYNEWQFVYDPALDRGGLITRPNQPLTAFNNTNLNGQNGQNGQQPGNGNPGSSSFGNQPGGFGNSSTPGPGGISSPNQPPQPNDTPNQQ